MIDPALSYSTYLGGNDYDSANGIAVDSSGLVYVTGQTYSTNYTTLNQYQLDEAGSDAYVTKLDPNLSGAASLLYSTYLGGGAGDGCSGIAVDSSGIAYVTGTTGSTNFPLKNQYQTYQAFNDAFVTKASRGRSRGQERRPPSAL